MKETRTIMGMPATLHIVDDISQDVVEEVFSYLVSIDEKFSTYKETSEIQAINRGELTIDKATLEMKEVFLLSEQTKKDAHGYFDIKKADGQYDPSGLVKGWAIYNAANILRKNGVLNFCIEIAGDLEVSGKNNEGEVWKIGIQNPFVSKQESIKTLKIEKGGVATSGNYIRGNHIYNPREFYDIPKDIVSMTVIGPTVYDADRYATAAFAMGKAGIQFIEQLDGYEGYMIDKNGIATMTSKFTHYI